MSDSAPSRLSLPSENLVIVGCGEHFQKNVGPTLATMEAVGEVRVTATVDLKSRDPELKFLRRPVPHVIRAPGVQLSSCLQEYKVDHPVVLLAHSHDWHASDALDLISAGFRVIVEKPYAITRSDLYLMREVARTHPQSLALAEYYMMMKAAPLLQYAGLLTSGSFYLHDDSYLRSAIEGSDVQSFAGALDRIGRVRMVYVDVLEGDGETGSFHHRGRQFADNRSGIGVLLDLAIHAIAPVIALESNFGLLPPSGEVLLDTAVCSEFVKFAEQKYGVPSRFVPETYAELAFSTSTGVLAVVAVGKYVLSSSNQRRLFIVGDEGEAFLDMSSCTLRVAAGDGDSKAFLFSPKEAESKYRAVFRASLAQLNGDSPFTFDARDVALKANEWIFDLHSRATEDSSSRRLYRAGSSPGIILTRRPSLGARATTKSSEQDAGTKVYYEHQYQRMAALEDQSFKMSAGVFVLTAAVFTFASKADVDSLLSWRVIISLMALGNLVAVLYTLRVMDSVHVHGRRAKQVLRTNWPAMWAVDQETKQRFQGAVQMRPLLLIGLHATLILASLLLWWSPTQAHRDRQSLVPISESHSVPAPASAPAVQTMPGHEKDSVPSQVSHPKPSQGQQQPEQKR